LHNGVETPLSLHLINPFTEVNGNKRNTGREILEGEMDINPFTEVKGNNKTHQF